jgi:hypothetical protein
MSTHPLILWAALVAGLCLCVAVARRLFIRARPDEWLLLIRNGRQVQAGVGINVLRRPGDTVARFTATVQRVRFEASALTVERLQVVIEGFLLWAVAPERGAPFQAFSKLGIVNLADRRPPGQNRKHLLTRPQHHAFQQLLAAAAQRHAAGFTMDALLGDQDRFVTGLRERLLASIGGMGATIEGLQILRIRPADTEVLQRLAVNSLEQIREQAARVQLETEERIRQREIESAAALANEESSALRDREVHEARTKHAIEAERAELLARQLELEKRRLDHESEVTRLQVEHEHAIHLRALKLARQRELVEEENSAAVSERRREREAEELAARLDGARAEARAERDAITTVASAHEQTSAEVRDYELSRLATERVSDALARLPLHDASWVNIGSDSPLSGIAALVAGARSVISGCSERPPQ